MQRLYFKIFRRRSRSLLQAFRRSPHQCIVRQATPLRAGQAAGADIIVVLRDPAVRVFALEPLEAVGRDGAATAEVRVLQGLLGGDPLGGVVLEQPGQQVVPVRAGGARTRVGGVPVVLEAALVPALEVRGAAEVAGGPRHGQGLQLGVLRHRDDARPSLLGRQAHDLHDLHHLVALEGHRLLAIHLGLLALEDGPQREQLREDAPHRPQIHRGRVVPASHEELGGTIPDRDDDFVAREEGVEGLVEEAGEPEIPDADGAAGGDQDVRGLEISMQHPVGVEIEEAVQQLEQDRFDHRRWDRMSLRLRVVVDDLQEIVLRVLEHHEDALVFQDDLCQLHHIGMVKLGAQSHLSDRRLRETSVLHYLPFLVRLEPVVGQRRAI